MPKSIIIKYLADYLKLSISAFEREIGASAGVITKAINRDADISPLLKEKISRKYPNINKDWLETGEGDIFIIPHHGEKAVKKIPILGEAAAGGDMQMAYNDNINDVEYIDVGDLLRDSEAAFIVYGNSMTPNYPSGCVLGIKRNYDGFIQPGETYLLLTKSNRVFKRLYYNSEKTGYKCVSDNSMKHPSGHQEEGEFIYPSFPVKFEDVISVHDVVGMIRRNRNSGIIQRQK